MPIINLNQMHQNESSRNFDDTVDANTLVSAENSQGTFGAFKFFTGIKAFFKGISALGTLTTTSRIPVTDSNGNVSYTTVGGINTFIKNNLESYKNKRDGISVQSYGKVVVVQIFIEDTIAGSYKDYDGYIPSNLKPSEGVYNIAFDEGNNLLEFGVLSDGKIRIYPLGKSVSKAMGMIVYVI